MLSPPGSLALTGSQRRKTLRAFGGTTPLNPSWDFYRRRKRKTTVLKYPLCAQQNPPWINKS
jgi:hypothetical protein